jgi:hypothetical protein
VDRTLTLTTSIGSSTDLLKYRHRCVVLTEG